MTILLTVCVGVVEMLLKNILAVVLIISVLLGVGEISYIMVTCEYSSDISSPPLDRMINFPNTVCGLSIMLANSFNFTSTDFFFTYWLNERLVMLKI